MAYESPITINYEEGIPEFRTFHEEINEKLECRIMASVQEKMAIQINKEELIKALNYDRHQYEKGFMDGKATAPEWIPIETRPMTAKEEKEVCEKWGINDGTLEDWGKKVFTCRLPDKNQQILISTHWGISLDICTWDEDEGIGLEERGDWDGVLAWMPVPEPYRPEEETE